MRREPEAYRAAAGRYHPARQVVIETPKYRLIVPISAGGSDDVEVYREGSDYWIVTVNSSLGYAGLETVSADPTALANGRSVFLQHDHEIAEILGPRGTDLHVRTIARRLSAYLGD